MRNKLLLSLSLFAIGACVPKTEFHGDPRVPNGRAGCEQVCSNCGMVLAGMVAMGDSYTDGCICMVPNQPGVAVINVAAVAPAAAGVIMQTRDDEEEERRRQQQMQQQ